MSDSDSGAPCACCGAAVGEPHRAWCGDVYVRRQAARERNRTANKVVVTAVPSEITRAMENAALLAWFEADRHISVRQQMHNAIAAALKAKTDAAS